MTSDGGLRASFYEVVVDDKNLTHFDFSSLVEATGRDSFYHALAGTSIVSAEFPALVYVGGQQSFNGALGWCLELTSASFPELTSVSNANAGMQTVMKGCPKLRQVSFPKL